METGRNTNNMLKQALERRQTSDLPSNFSYRMMERVQLEVKKKQKCKIRLNIIALSSAVLSVLGLGIYFLVFYLEFNLADYMPSLDIKKDFVLLGFYGYVALLALLLLGLDYWLRKKYIWK